MDTVWRRSPKHLEKFKDIFERAAPKWPNFGWGETTHGDRVPPHWEDDRPPGSTQGSSFHVTPLLRCRRHDHPILSTDKFVVREFKSITVRNTICPSPRGESKLKRKPSLVSPQEPADKSCPHLAKPHLPKPPNFLVFLLLLLVVAWSKCELRSKTAEGEETIRNQVCHNVGSCLSWCECDSVGIRSGP